jgi:YspA, cpYpsA-related SLOG family
LIYAVIGSRTFCDYEKLADVLFPQISYISKIVSGGAKGADTLAAKFADTNKIPLREIFPDYDKYGSSAPFVRNKEIVAAADIVFAFWDGKSRGTKHALDYAKKLKIKSIIINFDTRIITEETDLWQM